MNEDLIDPEEMFVPKANPDALESAASDIRSQGGKIAQSGQDITGSWSGLASCCDFEDELPWSGGADRA